MEEFWYEEELVPTEETVEEAVKMITRATKASEKEAKEAVGSIGVGILRVDKPRWDQLDPQAHELLTSGGEARFYKVRLGFQFDVSPEARAAQVRFIYARCSAYLWPAKAGEPQPTVYDLFPRDLYEGEARQVAVKAGPKLKLDKAEVSLGEISTDFEIGVVEPVVVGWPGEGERAPYWDLRPKSKTLEGPRHLWLVIEAPPQCSGVRLAVAAEGDLQAHWGPLPVGPKERVWAKRAERHSIVIP